MEVSSASVDSGEAAVLQVRRSVPWVAGALAILVASSALPQGNIDAGKSPAQMFADTCSNCHRRPSDLKRGASAGFLRQHYTPGAQEAAAMASYLASIPADPRAGKAKAPPQDKEKEKAKAQAQVQERPKAAQQPAPKGKRPEVGKSDPAAEASPEPRAEAVSVPKLEPFEE